MHRAIEKHIKKPIIDDILFGKLISGGEVHVDVINQNLAFVIKSDTPLLTNNQSETEKAENP